MKIKLGKKSLAFCVSLACVYSMHGFAQQSSKAEQVDSLVERWLSTEQQQSALTNEWITQQPLLEQRLTLLKAEQKQLTQLLAQDSESGNEVDQARGELLALQNSMETDQAYLTGWLKTQFINVNDLIYRLPPPLEKSWREQLSVHDGTDNDQANKNLKSNSDRLTLLLKLFDDLSQFDSRISSYQSAITLPNGEQKLVSQIYMGISLGWYISLDNTYAAQGFATDNGWRWQAIDDQQSVLQVKQMLAMLNQQKEAEFINLNILLAPQGSHINTESAHD
nr:DUF3450 family protein [Pseudoalteromonas sp. NEC-BIFX-2020_015]